MKIKKLIVENLFDTFTHQIDFQENSNITLILGQNGLGKTVVLKIIQAIFEGNFIQLENIDFSSIEIEFTDTTKWLISKEVTESDNKFSLTFSLIQNDQIIDQIDFSEVNENYEKLKRAISKYLPTPFRRMEDDLWFDRRSDVSYTTKEILTKYKSYFPEELYRDYMIFPEWYTTVIQNQNVALIETQRLLTLSKETDDYRYRDRDRNQLLYKNTVEEYSENLVYEIRSQLAKSSELATKLDRTYPNRLIERLKKSTQKISQEALNESLTNLESKRNRLQEVGLLDLQNQPHLNNIDEVQDEKIRDVLQVYIEDSRQKLDVYDQLADRIELFLKIINERFLQKKLTITKEEGFHFESLKNGKTIPLKSLSSGEQHIIVLYYELLFKLKENTLLLMDEPEISLHIAWQKRIISDLQEILKLNRMDVIIATHSPAVIGNNWDLTVELDAE